MSRLSAVSISGSAALWHHYTAGTGAVAVILVMLMPALVAMGGRGSHEDQPRTCPADALARSRLHGLGRRLPRALCRRCRSAANYGWHLMQFAGGVTVQRAMLVALFLATVAATGVVAWLSWRRWSGARRRAPAVAPARFLEWAAVGSSLTAVVAATVSLAPAVVSDQLLLSAVPRGWRFQAVPPRENLRF